MKENTFLTDMHTHTYPASLDAKNSLSDMVLSALDKGVRYYGLSNHFDYDFDTSIKDTEVEEYKAQYFQEARRLQKQYAPQMHLLVGAEFGYGENQDVHECYTSAYARYQPDFVINSVHRGTYRSPAFSRAVLTGTKKEIVDRYLRLVRQSLDVPYPYDIVGHLEYVARYLPFSDKSIALEEYQTQFDDILQVIIQKGKILEVNTAVNGIEQTTLPSVAVLKRYFALGGRKVCYGSDSHTKDRILDRYQEVIELLKNVGFTHFTLPIKGKYKEISILP